ncbi:30S ribosomal protein S17 [Candidatus Gottesmanbacteria bacterium]|nr:30S ribosomal protein S17 [Candidatus Gottesmanbacteria bacterium]
MKNIIGKIVSTKMMKTIVVEVARQRVHPLYKKIMRRTARIKVHNEDETLKVGDMVKITSTRPLSKTKHFKVTGKI